MKTGILSLASAILFVFPSNTGIQPDSWIGCKARVSWSSGGIAGRADGLVTLWNQNPGLEQVELDGQIDVAGTGKVILSSTSVPFDFSNLQCK